MSEYKFKSGDRVVLARPDGRYIDERLRRGDIGTVDEDFSTAPFVTFDGKPTDGCVFAISEKQLDHLAEEPIQVPKTESVLAEAQRLVHGDRNVSYGPPIEDFQCQAEMLTSYFKRKGILKEGKGIEATDIAPMMILIKMAREAHRHKHDNYTDAAGYSECGEMVWEALQNAQDDSRDLSR